jgi:hypothetical protein
MEQKPKITVSIKINDDIWTNFRHLCIDEDVKYGNKIEEIIQEYLEKKKRRVKNE